MTVQFTGLSIFRGAVLAVRDAAGSIERGTWTGIVGANGSGKTTLLRALAGRLPAASGAILFDGDDRIADRHWRAARCGYAPDIGALPAGLSARQYVRLIERGGSHVGERRLADLRAALAVDGFADRDFSQLSAGMKQRVALLAAFAGGHDLVLLDEPFNWLDPVCAYDTKAALKAMVERQELTLVTALHEMSTLTLHCDRGLLMAEGRVHRKLGLEELRAGARDMAKFEAGIIADLRAG